ncbi:MAG: FAD-binding domain-containing protein [Chitinophagaceae bacterium]
MIKNIAGAKTGITAIDEQITLLYETGYMHNPVRMYLAGITCNIGKAHWLQPARWMYYHLLDGDLASNSLSWQ